MIQKKKLHDKCSHGCTSQYIKKKNSDIFHAKLWCMTACLISIVSATYKTTLLIYIDVHADKLHQISDSTNESCA